MMKYLLLGFFCVISISLTEAQVTNLTVNGTSSNFTMISGNAVSWSYNLPTGATANCELWYDVNQNGSIDPATDVSLFIFTQTDGNSNGNGGPPDMDGAVNGSISFSQPVGFAPGKYVFKVTNNGSGSAIAGTVTALSSPAHLISGHVTPPAGKSARYIVIEAHRNDQAGQPNFWHGITDSSGNYTIQMNADTAGNPWQIRINTNPFPPSIVTPEQIELVITGNHSGNDFTFVAAAAQVTGRIKDDNGNDLPQTGIFLRRNDGNVQHNAQSNGSGFFQIGLQASELNSDTWYLENECNCNNGITQNILTTQYILPAISTNDSLYRTMTVYSVNSQIQGQLRVNGAPFHYTTQIMATNDTAFAEAYTDSATGNFTIPVSNKIQNYHFSIGGLPFGWEVQYTIAHPGDTGVIVNISTQTSILVNWDNSWNILSVPVKVSNNQKSFLFPQAVSPAYSYTAAGGYQQQSNLFNSIGYWMKFNGSNAASINGTYIGQETVAVATGWNLIGTITDSVSTSSIIPLGTPTPSTYFGYSSSGYSSVSILRAGLGYWVKVSADGQLLLHSSSMAPSAGRKQLPDERESFNRIDFKGADGNVRSVYFSSRPDLDLRKYELPPLPPPGIMDVRYASNRYLESAGGDRPIGIDISSAKFPVTVSWRITDAKISGTLYVDGKPIVGSGEVRIPYSDSRVEVRLDSRDPAAPKEFALSQNYPNPFNPTTSIKYSIADGKFVRLSLYNVLGQEVATLVNEVKQPGEYSAVWDASNLPSGIYIARLSAGSFVQSEKILLMK